MPRLNCVFNVLDSALYPEDKIEKLNAAISKEDAILWSQGHSAKPSQLIRVAFKLRDGRLKLEYNLDTKAKHYRLNEAAVLGWLLANEIIASPSHEAETLMDDLAQRPGPPVVPPLNLPVPDVEPMPDAPQAEVLSPPTADEADEPEAELEADPAALDSMLQVCELIKARTKAAVKTRNSPKKPRAKRVSPPPESVAADVICQAASKPKVIEVELDESEEEHEQEQADDNAGERPDNLYEENISARGLQSQKDLSDPSREIIELTRERDSLISNRNAMRMSMSVVGAGLIVLAWI